MNSNYFKLLDNNSKLLEKKNKELYEVFIEKTKADLIKLYEQKQYSRSDYYKAEQNAKRTALKVFGKKF